MPNLDEIRHRQIKEQEKLQQSADQKYLKAQQQKLSEQREYQRDREKARKKSSSKALESAKYLYKKIAYDYVQLRADLKPLTDAFAFRYELSDYIATKLTDCHGLTCSEYFQVVAKSITDQFAEKSEGLKCSLISTASGWKFIRGIWEPSAQPVYYLIITPNAIDFSKLVIISRKVTPGMKDQDKKDQDKLRKEWLLHSGPLDLMHQIIEANKKLPYPKFGARICDLYPVTLKPSITKLPLSYIGSHGTIPTLDSVHSSHLDIAPEFKPSHTFV